LYDVNEKTMKIQMTTDKLTSIDRSKVVDIHEIDLFSEKVIISITYKMM
jgi:hypothetical protein